MSRPVPLRHASSKIVDSRTWSRLLIGFASRSSSASSPDTTVAMRSRNAAVSCSSSAGGAANERTTDSGRPDFGARRVDREIDGVAEFARCARASDPTRPGRSSSSRLSALRIARRSGPCAAPRRNRPTTGTRPLPGAERSAAGCRGRPWDRCRSPGCRRCRPLRAAPGTGRSCRCRSCRRRRRASSGRASRRAADCRTVRASLRRIPDRDRKRRVFRSPAWLRSPHSQRCRINLPTEKRFDFLCRGEQGEEWPFE